MAAGKSPGRSTGSSYENGVDNWIVSIFFGGVCGYCYCEQHHETKNWLALQPARLSALSSLSVQAAKIGQRAKQRWKKLLQQTLSSYDIKILGFWTPKTAIGKWAFIPPQQQSSSRFGPIPKTVQLSICRWAKKGSTTVTTGAPNIVLHWDLLPGNIQVLWKMLWTPWFWYGFVKNSWMNREFTVWLSQSGNLGVSCFQRTTMNPYVHWNAGMGQYL